MMTNGEPAGDMPRFIIDHNVGKLTRWLRMLGFDSLFFTGKDDAEMVDVALKENRIILTRDTGITRRRPVTKGKVKMICFSTVKPEQQIHQVVNVLKLAEKTLPFTRCLECNAPLVKRSLDEISNRVPPYVAMTHHSYSECPVCHRIFWQGTHWQAMTKKVISLTQ